jgi:RIO kinase 1
LSEDYEDVARRKELKVERGKGRQTHDDDLLKTVEEVFDRKTVMTLYQMINKGHIERVFGVVKAGKESRIYWAEGKHGENLALKIFLTSSREFKNSMRQYIQGDPRFKIGKDSRQMIYTWAKKEYKNLSGAYDAGIPVPKPYYQIDNVLVLEFIGNKGEPAPLLKQLPAEAVTCDIYNQVFESLEILYRKVGLVHADLSEYNIMVHKGKAYFIDFGQAVTKAHPMANEFLRRDVANLIRFFERSGLNVPDEESVLKWLKRP